MSKASPFASGRHWSLLLRHDSGFGVWLNNTMYYNGDHGFGEGVDSFPEVANKAIILN